MPGNLYAPEFPPYLSPGQTVHVIKASGETDIEIYAVDSLPHHLKDWGALTTTESTDNDAGELDMPNGELAQYRFSIADLYEVSLNHPGPSQRWRTDTTRFKFRHWPNMTEKQRDFMWAATEFWVYQDETPRFNLVALNSGQSVQGYMEFMGWRYKFRTFDEVRKLGREPGQRGAIDLFISWP